MKLIKFGIVLALAVAIFGTIGFFAWQLYIKPEQIERRQEKIEANAPPPTPPPDFSLPVLDRALALKKQGKLLEARDALMNFIVQYPQSTKLADAKAAVGEINTQFVFTSEPGPDKIDYTVVPGDSLVKVANKTKSNAELILRSNNLASIDLSVGQALRIPQLEISLVIDRKAKTLSVMNKGQLFKEYPAPGDGSARECARQRSRPDADQGQDRDQGIGPRGVRHPGLRGQRPLADAGPYQRRYSRQGRRKRADARRHRRFTGRHRGDFSARRAAHFRHHPIRV